MIIGHYYNPPVSFQCFIFEASNEEYDVTQFNQLNLNSSISIGLLPLGY